MLRSPEISEQDRSPSGAPRTTAGRENSRRPLNVMLFTDTLGDVNGVSRFIRNIAGEALETGRNLSVVTSTRFDIPNQPNIFNFPPVMARSMPGYENLELVLPPFIKMFRFAATNPPDVIHISTPGPVGLVGRLAAMRLGIPVVGVYHTDFPAYIDRLFQDDALTCICRSAMRAFYRSFRMVLTRSETYACSLDSIGVPRDRTLRLTPGIRTADFSPTLNDRSVWISHGGNPKTVRALYVGRLSVEKNMPLLARAWKLADAELRSRGIDAELVVIGDGPYRKELELSLSDCRVRFLGFRYDAELTRLYASSDFFLFPSTTDTLGQVVMEAQCAGLPAIVTDKGGPKETVANGLSGLVVPSEDPSGWSRAIVQLASDSGLRTQMSLAAHALMLPRSMSSSFEHFWSVHERVRDAHRVSSGSGLGASFAS